MGYAYKGTNHDTDEPVATRHPPTTEFNPDRCGTHAGYRQHQKYKIPACQDCKDAQAAYSRDDWHRRKTTPVRAKGFDPSACGTYAGYARHKRSDVPTCAACQTAHADYIAEYRKRRTAAHG